MLQSRDFLHGFQDYSNMKEDAALNQKGCSGEMTVDYHLDMLAPTHTILQDVYLRVNGHGFQMDSLLVSKHAFYIIESKNVEGTITFNTILKQLIRDSGETESGFNYPITQVENQKFHLKNWLARRNLGHIPVYYYVAIAETSTIIKVEGDAQEIAKVVAHGAAVPTMIIENDREFAQHSGKALQHHQIGKSILRECGVFDIDIFNYYGLTYSDFLPGVICPGCGFRGMTRIHNGWLCGECKYKSRNAHLNTLRDYFLLGNDFITNSICTWFLGLPNRGTATRILKNSGLVFQGKHKRWVLPSKRKSS